MLPALILSAGIGSRLDPLTRLVAKPVVPLAGRTLIERVIGWLTTAGVTDVVINLHHRPETIAAVVGDGSSLGVRVRYSWEPTILGSAGGPRHALPLLDADTFLIVNGDTLVDFALTPMIAQHEARGADVTVAVVPNPRPDHYHGMALDGDDRVTRLRAPHRGPAELALRGRSGRARERVRVARRQRRGRNGHGRVSRARGHAAGRAAGVSRDDDVPRRRHAARLPRRGAAARRTGAQRDRIRRGVRRRRASHPHRRLARRPRRSRRHAR